jgi:uncharacterized integral membrane protein (TIGR00698 family)
VASTEEREDVVDERPVGLVVDTLRRYVPGLVLVAVGLAAAILVNAAIPSVSRLVAAVVIGAILGNVGFATPATRPGLTFAAKRLMRVGVVLLGLRLSIGQITDLGAATVAVIVVAVFSTFFGTQWLGRRMGLSNGLSLLVGTGFAVCGLSAIAAVEEASDASEEEIATAMGLVTLFGTLAIFAVPFAGHLIGLDDQQLGTWVGASVHDTAQVVAAASTGGATVLSVAIAVKLTRILLLAPIVAGVNITRSRAVVRTATADPDQSDGTDLKRPSPVPLFVAGFMGCVLIRTSGVLGDSALDAAKEIEGLVLAAAMVGLGAAVNFGRIRKLGPRPVVLGAVSWVGIALISLGAVVLTS